MVSPDQWLDVSLETAWRRKEDRQTDGGKQREKQEPKTLLVKKGGEQEGQKPD